MHPITVRVATWLRERGSAKHGKEQKRPSAAQPDFQKPVFDAPHITLEPIIPGMGSIGGTRIKIVAPGRKE